jgi:inhibitor of KinA
VEFGDVISREARLSVHRLAALLLEERRRDILNVHPAYTSVLITFDPRITELPELERFVRQLVKRCGSVRLPPSRMVEIAVCYDGEFGPDLGTVARHHHMSWADVIRIHSSATYVVHFLGFSPGFPYMGGLPEEIATPRHSTPRLSVAGGSVAIAGNQAGIYPVASPGGWHVIGRTPLRLFDLTLDPPALLALGDEVRFVPIPRAEFETMSGRSEGDR